MKQTMVQTRVCLVVGSFSNTLQRRTSKRRVRETTALMLLVGISSCKAKNEEMLFTLPISFGEET